MRATPCTRVPPIDDRGQRYEVRCTKDGQDFICGWTEHADGGGLVKLVNQHPDMSEPRIIDRKWVT